MSSPLVGVVAHSDAGPISSSVKPTGPCRELPKLYDSLWKARGAATIRESSGLPAPKDECQSSAGLVALCSLSTAKMVVLGMRGHG